MDSSPPSVGAQRHGHEAGGRDMTPYTLDLNALSHDSANDTSSSPLPLRKLDQVRSEDIDGPSDFTLNMEDWMRGTHKGAKKGTMRSAKGTLGRPGTMGRGTVRGMFAQDPGAQIAEEADEEAAPDQAAGVVSANQDYEKHDDTPIPDFGDSSFQGQGDMDDARSGTATPRMSKENDLSLWDAQISNSSSADAEQGQHAGLQRMSDSPSKKSDFLQPTVEDYYSELSPGRPSSAPPLPSHHFRPDEHMPGPPPPPHQSDQHRTPAMLLRELEAMRAARDQAELKSQLLDEQLRASSEARQSLQRQLDASTEALSTANARASTSGRVQGAVRSIESEDQLAAERATVANLRRSLSQTQKERDELKLQLDEMRESEDEELHNLRWQLKTLRESSDAAAKQAENSKRESAEELVRLQKELDVYKQEQEALPVDASTKSQTPSPGYDSSTLDAIKIQLDQANTLNADLHQQLRDAQASKDAVTSHKQQPQQGKELEDAREEIEHLRDELDLLQNLSRLDNDDDSDQHKHARTASTVSDTAALTAMRAELDDMKDRSARAEGLGAQRQQQILGLSETIAALTRSSKPSTRTDDGVSQQLRESERQRPDMHSRLDIMRTELDSLRQANATMDERVVELLRKREDEWRTRQAEWEKERKVMVKALLWGWGREECGVDFGREQRYQYRYVNKGLA